MKSNVEKNEKNDRNGTETMVHNSRLMNVILFVVCLVVAIGVWIYAVQSDTTEYEETFSVKVDLVNTSVLETGTGLSIFSGDNTSIDVTLVGSRNDVTSMTADQITATADVSTITHAGTFSLNITVKVNGNVTVKSLSGSSVTVYADRRNTVILPIKARLVRATHQTSYVVQDPVPSLETVTVTGPSATLDTLDYAEAVIDFDNQILTTSIVSICPIRLIGKNGSEVQNPYLSTSVSEVQVGVGVYTEKEVALKVLFKNGYFNDDVVQTTVTPASVLVKGDPVILAGLNEIVLGTIDERLIIDDAGSTFPINLPQGITLSDPKVSEAKLEIKSHNRYLKTAIRTFHVTDIQVTGASGIYTLEDTALDITVRAMPNYIDRLQFVNSSDISVVVNLSSFGEGVTGTVNAAAEIRIASSSEKYIYPIGEYAVRVTLS